MKTFGFLGFTFENPNKGCEALTYSFISILQKFYGNRIGIRFYSTTHKLGRIKEYFPDIEFTFYYTSRKNILLHLKADFEKNCDAIFDISFGDGFSDIYNPKAEAVNAWMKIVAGKSKVPFILLPQTYGPFERKMLEKQAAFAIRKASIVFSRDALSTKYVKDISGVDAVTVTDLAFLLPYMKKDEFSNEKIKLGINVSGLLWNGGFYKKNQFGLAVNYQEYVTKLIEHYLQDERYEVHIIPHVIETSAVDNDGDVFVSEILKERYPNLIIAPSFLDPIETKNYIAQMDIITAARMHATVDAFSAFVPVVPFAYSRKFEGLYSGLDYKYIVDGKAISTESALNKTIEYIENRFELLASVRSGMEMVNNKSTMFINLLSENMGKYGV